jgi:hemerythrin-like domain-containing protein
MAGLGSVSILISEVAASALQLQELDVNGSGVSLRRILMRRITTRRRFLKGSSVLLAATAVGGPLSLLAQETSQPDKEEKSADNKAEEVSPDEDLMREHGVLDRILLIYGEVLIRLHEGQTVPPEVLTSGAGLVRRFIEDYHEKLEEEYLFPRFEKAGKLVELVQVLRQQHQAGRRLTETIKNRAPAAMRKNADDQKALLEAVHGFIRMYRPHAAREDTVLFPAFRSLVSLHEHDALGEEFEDKEHALFGEDSFTKIVDEVAQTEKALGIYDLAQFTPQL